MHRRSLLGSLASVSLLTVSGCVDSDNPFDEWEFEERERDGWSSFTTAYSVIRSVDSQDDSSLVDAKNAFEDAKETYGTLENEITDVDQLEYDDRDYFSEMYRAANTGLNCLDAAFDGYKPGTSDFDHHFYAIGHVLEDAGTELQQNEHLAETIDRTSEELTTDVPLIPAHDEQNIQLGESVVEQIDDEFGLADLQGHGGWAISRKHLMVNFFISGDLEQDISNIAELYADAVESGLDLHAEITRAERTEPLIKADLYSFDVELSWATSFNAGEIDERTYLDRIEENVTVSKL